MNSEQLFAADKLKFIARLAVWWWHPQIHTPPLDYRP
jgi:hypothetical protein